MTFPRWTFRLAGLYGVIVIGLGYFTVPTVNRDYPPAITHVEYFFGFMGLAFVFQLLFLLISTDPIRYRPLMILSVLEKISFVIPAAILFAQQNLPTPMAAGASIDGLLAILFLISYLRTPGYET